MKKMFAVLLALCLLGGAAAAMAEDNTITNSSTDKEAKTTVKVEIPAGYTVTIPASIDINPNTRTGSGKVTIADYPCLSVGKKTLNVYVDKPANTIPGDGATNLKDSANHELYYRMYKDNSTTAIYSKTRLLQVSGGATASKEKLSVTLNFVLPEAYAIYQYAGEYTDTLTFIVAEE